MFPSIHLSSLDHVAVLGLHLRVLLQQRRRLRNDLGQEGVDVVLEVALLLGGLLHTVLEVHDYLDQVLGEKKETLDSRNLGTVFFLSFMCFNIKLGKEKNCCN